MPANRMQFNDTEVRTAEILDEASKRAGERGFYRLVNPSVGRFWQFKPRIAGAENVPADGGCS